MGTKSNQVLSQTQQQVQSLSPQQILLAKLLELPTTELEARIHAEVLDNPALAEGDDNTGNELSSEEEFGDSSNSLYDEAESVLGDYRTEDDIPDYKLREYQTSKGKAVEDIPFSDSVSFYEMLHEQLAEQNLSEQQQIIAEYLVGSLDDDGLLRKPIQAILDELSIYRAIYATEAEVKQVLQVVQELDPAGIGACSVQECLLIQLKRKQKTPLLDLQIRLISEYFDDFTRNNRERIMQQLGINEEVYEEMYAELKRLNPRPGSALGEELGKNYQQIMPDFILTVDEDDNISFVLNDYYLPKLCLDRDFVDLYEKQSDNKQRASKDNGDDASLFMKQKVDAAQQFINAVQQRHHTLTVTMQTIVEMQREFFLEGDEALIKPMVLKDVANRTGLNISTISRVSNSKYVQTSYGIFPLKFFFNDGFTTQDGEELSVREIKQILKELVETEDKRKPYTDEKLAEQLNAKGYPVARRTVAKYREQLNIPVAKLRRK